MLQGNRNRHQAQDPFPARELTQLLGSFQKILGSFRKVWEASRSFWEASRRSGKLPTRDQGDVCSAAARPSLISRHTSAQQDAAAARPSAALGRASAFIAL